MALPSMANSTTAFHTSFRAGGVTLIPTLGVRAGHFSVSVRYTKRTTVTNAGADTLIFPVVWSLLASISMSMSTLADSKQDEFRPLNGLSLDRTEAYNERHNCT